MAKNVFSNGSPMDPLTLKMNLDIIQRHDRSGGKSLGSGHQARKSNVVTTITHKSLSSDSESGEDGSDDDAGGGELDSDSDGSGASDEDPDAVALSGSGAHNEAHKKHRPAGLFSDDMNDEINEIAHETTAEVSDDDDYADVEEVSDDQDSIVDVKEGDALRFAEEDLIKEFEEQEHTQTTDAMFPNDEAMARSLGLSMNDTRQNSIDDFNIDLNEDPFVGLPLDEALYTDMLADAELAIWRMPHPHRESNDAPNTTQKRVRFEENQSHESSDSSSEDGDGDDDFPDLFAAADDPLLRQRLALANAQEMQLAQAEMADVGSEYDFDGEEEKMAFELDEDSSSDEDESSCDSEDDGDTTDDESAEEQIARMQEMKKALGKSQESPATAVNAKRIIQTPTRATGNGRLSTSRTGRGPVEGTFLLDPTRASISANATGTRIQVRPPVNPPEKEKAFWDRARAATSSRHGSPQNSLITVPSPGCTNVTPRPFTAQSTLGSMFDGNLDILNNNDVETGFDDWTPHSLHLTTPHRSFTTSSTTEMSGDEMPDVNMGEFLELDLSDSDEEEEPSMDVVMSPTDLHSQDVFSSNDNLPQRSNALLDHLSQNRGIVGSFRRNQHHAKHVSSLASHPATRASASEYNALQKGRRAAGNSPMTPARKTRTGSDLSIPRGGIGITKSVASPLTARRPRSRGGSIGNGLNAAGLYKTLSSSPF